MRLRSMLTAVVLAGVVSTAVASHFTREFFVEDCSWSPDGKNPYFSIKPGNFRRLEGTDEDGIDVVVEITVLRRTKMVTIRGPEGERIRVRTRVIEEREWENGNLKEISRNYFARCKGTGDIYYFGEDVKIYNARGRLVSRDGSWRAGRDGAEPGLIMPSVFLVGAKYFQEVAPGIAMDRAHHTRTGLEVVTPLATFQDCVKVVETTPLERGERSIKKYAPGFGLIYDDGIELVQLRQ